MNSGMSEKTMSDDSRITNEPTPTALFFIAAVIFSLVLVPAGEVVGGTVGMWLWGIGFVLSSIFGLIGIAWAWSGIAGSVCGK